MDIFCVRLKELKERDHLTYSQIAEHLGLSAIRTVKGYADGSLKPSYHALIALADYFDVSLDYLVGRSDDPARH